MTPPTAREIVEQWRAEGVCECHDDDQRLEWAITEALAAAVRAERERCIDIVASLAIPHPEVSVPPEYQTTAEIRNETLEEVAAALRAPEATDA